MKTKIIVIGGIESSYLNAQLLFDLGAEIGMFFTRGKNASGWEGVDFVEESKFEFIRSVPKIEVDGSINQHVAIMKKIKPDFIFSLGWQQMYSPEILSLCPVVGIHESLLPIGAGACPIANAILHDQPVTGVTLFQLDEGMDTGPIIGQLRGLLDPRKANSTQLYREAIELERELLKVYFPLLACGKAPRISQNPSDRIVYEKINWGDWSQEKQKRARVYPYA